MKWFLIDNADADLAIGYRGRVISWHRSQDAAEQKAERLLRAHRRRHGPLAYLWTEVRPQPHTRIAAGSGGARLAYAAGRWGDGVCDAAL